MFSSPQNKKAVGYWSTRVSFITAILVLVSLMLVYISMGMLNLRSDTAIVDDIQQHLRAGKQFVKLSLVSLEEEFVSGGKEGFIYEATEIEKQYEESFAFFLYKDGSLYAWSNNYVAAPRSIKHLSDDYMQRIGVYRCVVYRHKMLQYEFVGMQIISADYPWQNEILHNKMAPFFGLGNKVSVVATGALEIAVPWANNSFRVQKNALGDIPVNSLVFLVFALSFLIWSVVLGLGISMSKISNKLVKIAVFSVGLLFWYGLHRVLGIPANVFHTELFSPILYASNIFYSSFGNLFFVTYGILLWVIYYSLLYKNSSYNKLFGVYFYIILIFVSLAYVMRVTYSLVVDSQINFNLFRLATINEYSYMGVALIFFIQAAWLVMAYYWVNKIRYSPYIVPEHVLSAVFLAGLLSYFIKLDVLSFFMFFFTVVAFLLVWLFFRKRHTKRKQYYEIEVFVYLFLLSLVSTWFLMYNVGKKELNMRANQVLTWEPKNDAFLEEHFIASYDDLKTTLLKEFDNDISATTTVDSLLLYETVLPFFKSFTPYYKIRLSCCGTSMSSSDTTALEQNTFLETQKQRAESVIVENVLYLLQGDIKLRNYLGILSWKRDDGSEGVLLIEFYSKPRVLEVGLPALLQNNSYSKLKTLNQYSYAVYNKGKLIDNFGSYEYAKHKLPFLYMDTISTGLYKGNSFSHYYHTSADGNTLILSLSIPTLAEYISSFAFVFLFYIILSILFYTVLFNRLLLVYFYTFQGRSQYAILSVLLFSFIAIGIVGWYNISQLNTEKNTQIIQDKVDYVLNILKEKQFHLMYDSEGNAKCEKGQEHLRNLYNIFNTDVILYDNTGALLASTRPEIFKIGLLASFINPTALHQLKWGKSSFFLQKEHIGKQIYYSCYVPLQVADGATFYLNMPYFARQSDIEDELSAFAQSFLNVYLLLMFIAMVMGIVISRMLSRPIALIKDKMKALNLHSANEKIEWERQDELGDLINVYNRMVEELSVSTKKLAASQREKAWREMAKQVAHEIKNPLTPMKLNVQYLQRAWDNDAEDFDLRLKKITNGLVEQIDVLSYIAGQFSSFAAIAATNIEKVEMTTLIGNVLEVFKGTNNVKFPLDSVAKPSYVMADKTQMVRVFNNLYKNSVQAIDKNKPGLIETKIYHEGNKVVIEITDNGCGIAPEKFEYIFRPHFTTKTTGTGLGLALVKKMIETTGGSIHISSTLNVYTKVTVDLPLCQN